jgi:hypothetical protein
MHVAALGMVFMLCLGSASGLAQGLATQQRSPTGNLTAEELYKKVLPSVMTIVVDKPKGGSQGTAFLVSKDGLALTAWHVVKDGRRAVAKFSDGEEFEISGLVDKDEKRDLALVRVKVFGRPHLPLEGTDPAVGSKAYVVGAPRGMEFSISDGLISQIQIIDGMKQLQYTCPTSPGNSGGPVMNEKAQVVGVVSWGLRDSQNLNFAVPVSYALGLDTTLPTQPFDSVKSVGLSSGPVKSVGTVAETRAELASQCRKVRCGRLRLRATPKDAMVFIDDALVGVASNLDGFNGDLSLPPGIHRISFRAAGYVDETRDVTILSSRTVTVRVTLN